MKTLILAASLATVLMTGCAELRDEFRAPAAAGASAPTDASQNRSPYPAETDAGLF
jgi:hypothetical protein